MPDLEGEIISFFKRHINNKNFQKMLGFYFSKDLTVKTNVEIDEREYDILLYSKHKRTIRGKYLPEDIIVNFEIETGHASNKTFEKKHEKDKILCPILVNGASNNGMNSKKVYSFLTYNGKKIKRLLTNFYAENIRLSSSNNIKELQSIHDSKRINKNLKRSLLFFLNDYSKGNIYFESPIDMISSSTENLFIDTNELRSIENSGLMKIKISNYVNNTCDSNIAKSVLSKKRCLIASSDRREDYIVEMCKKLKIKKVYFVNSREDNLPLGKSLVKVLEL